MNKPLSSILGILAVSLIILTTPLLTQATAYKLVTLEYPPYEYNEGGKVKGLAVEIIKETFKLMGHDVTIEIFPWARSIEMFKNGEADGIFTFFKTPEREEYTYFSNEVVVVQPISLWTLKKSKIGFNGDLSKLKGYSFAAVRKTSYGDKFDTAVKTGMLKIDEADSIDSCIKKLMSGRVDIWVSNHYGAVFELKKAGVLKDVKEINPPIQDTLAYVGFSKKKNLQNIRDSFDKALAKLKSSGKYNKIIKNYMKKSL